MLRTIRKFSSPASKYDAIVVGGGHNGLTAAAYLAKAGKKVCVLERRHVLGGAAVTEEIVPGFKFSRASYLLSLLRPVVINELNLKDHGLKYHIRNPSSFTPIRNSKEYLLLGLDMKKNQEEIAKFSKWDAEQFPKYEHTITNIIKALEPLMDQKPINLSQNGLPLYKDLWKLFNTVRPLGLKNAADFYEIMTAPIAKVMDKWFESDVLKATIGTDGVIGAPVSPYDAGTGYVLLHHVLGGLDDCAGSWGYVYGGMGAVSEAIASSARSHGAEIFTEQEVEKVIIDGNKAKGVKLANGTEIHSDIVLSNTTPHVTFNKLVPKESLSQQFMRSIQSFDYTSPVTKINVAVRELPNFTCNPTVGKGPMPHHQTTIHMNCENMRIVDEGVVDFRAGRYSQKPMIEMTIPSSVDRTIVSDDSSHVCLLFTQYTPYTLKNGQWDEATTEAYARKVFSEIDAYAPNFSSSIVGYEVLTPPKLEEVFGITGGNIFHGGISLDQLYFARPVPSHSNYKSPIEGLYLCGSGTHPGGGVTGAPGRLAAMTVLGN